MLTDLEEAELSSLPADEVVACTPLFTSRLFACVQQTLREGRTSVAWPVWGVHLSHLGNAAGSITTYHLDRLPFIYRELVYYAVYGVLLVRDPPRVSPRVSPRNLLVSPLIFMCLRIAHAHAHVHVVGHAHVYTWLPTSMPTRMSTPMPTPVPA